MKASNRLMVCYIYTNICMSVFVNIFTYMILFVQNVCTHLYMRAYVCLHECVIFTYTYTCKVANVYIYIIFKYKFIFVHMDMYTHFISTYIFVYICKCIY